METDLLQKFFLPEIYGNAMNQNNYMLIHIFLSDDRDVQDEGKSCRRQLLKKNKTREQMDIHNRVQKMYYNNWKDDPE